MPVSSPPRCGVAHSPTWHRCCFRVSLVVPGMSLLVQSDSVWMLSECQLKIKSERVAFGLPNLRVRLLSVKFDFLEQKLRVCVLVGAFLGCFPLASRHCGYVQTHNEFISAQRHGTLLLREDVWIEQLQSPLWSSWRMFTWIRVSLQAVRLLREKGKCLTFSPKHSWWKQIVWVCVYR